MIVVGDHLPDAVTEADGFGESRGGSEENFGRRGMRIFFEEVVFDLPRVIEAEAVGQLDLMERLVKEVAFVALVPGPR